MWLQYIVSALIMFILVGMYYTMWSYQAMLVTLRLWTCSLSCFRVVIIFIMIKIFFYICWYRSRQRQLAAYLSNPRNAQIVIVGGRAYLHQVCERQNVSKLQFQFNQNNFFLFFSRCGQLGCASAAADIINVRKHGIV